MPVRNNERIHSCRHACGFMAQFISDLRKHEKTCGCPKPCTLCRSPLVSTETYVMLNCAGTEEHECCSDRSVGVLRTRVLCSAFFVLCVKNTSRCFHIDYILKHIFQCNFAINPFFRSNNH